MARNEEFFIHVNDTPKRLFVSRPESIKGDALSPCCMTPDDVDEEINCQSLGEERKPIAIKVENRRFFRRISPFYVSF